MLRRIARWTSITALLVGYPLLVHYTNLYAHSKNLGAIVSTAPVLAIAFVLSWNSPKRFIMLGALILLCVALWVEWSKLEQHFELIYWLQDVSIQLILLMTFGRTLFAGQQPLCTRFAEAVHPPLTPQHEKYARQVTVAWTLFFAVMAITTTLLFFLAPLSIWSVFTNFLILPLVATMFIAEYWIRKYALPDVKNAHFLDAVRAFRNTRTRPH